MTIPESYFQPCRIEPVEEGATTYEQAFNDVSVAYVATASNVAKCNARDAEGLELMRKNIERYKQQETKNGNSKPKQ